MENLCLTNEEWLSFLEVVGWLVTEETRGYVA
jgi:hypothetical protein